MMLSCAGNIFNNDTFKREKIACCKNEQYCINTLNLESCYQFRHSFLCCNNTARWHIVYIKHF